MAKKKPRPAIPKATGKTKPQAASKKISVPDQTDSASARKSPLSAYWPVGLVLLIAFLIYRQTFNFGFVNWDDEVNIHDNPNLILFNWESVKKIFTSHVIGNYNPLTILTFAIEKHFFGIESAYSYHLINVVLHLVVVWLVYKVSLRLGLETLYALLVAALFAWHPMRAESVAWVTERKDVLFAAFFFWALLAYIPYAQGNRTYGRMLWVVLPVFFLSLLSKIQAVTLPLSMLCVDYLMRRPLSLRLITEKIPFFILSLFFGLLGVYFLGQQESLDASGKLYSLGGRLLIGASSYVVYLLKWIWPWSMSPLYPYPAKLEWFHYASVIGIIGTVLWGVFAKRKDWRHVLFGLLFFTFNVVFLLQVVGAGQGYWADRFTYVPYFGLFFLMAAALQRTLQSRPHLKTPLLGVSAFYLVLLGAMCYKQVGIWKDPITLWTRVIEYEPKALLAWTNRAQHYRRTQQYDLAAKDYQEALRLKPEANTYNSIAKMYFDQKKPDEAIKYYQLGLERDSTNAEVWINMGAAYGMKNMYDEALMYLTKGIRLDPNNKNGYLNRGLLYFTTRQYAAAIEDNKAYLKLNPVHHEINYEIGLAYNSLGNYTEALKWLNTAIERKPELAVAYQQRAVAYYGLSQFDKAKADAIKAQQMGVQIDPRLLQ